MIPTAIDSIMNCLYKRELNFETLVEAKGAQQKRHSQSANQAMTLVGLRGGGTWMIP